jgi:hypothetical protein
MRKLGATLAFAMLATAGGRRGAQGPLPLCRRRRSPRAGSTRTQCLDTWRPWTPACTSLRVQACGLAQGESHPPDQTRWGRFNELAERNRNASSRSLRAGEGCAPRRNPGDKVGTITWPAWTSPGRPSRECWHEADRPDPGGWTRVASKEDLFRRLGENDAAAPQPPSASAPLRTRWRGFQADPRPAWARAAWACPDRDDNIKR